ncbi:hypothetical protein GGS24DRAFT_485964 [Hypoxylon argillaceum]|nr:hypothetical protein GGS24DRAFT_485964 [Hypoxylon argillaceum]
MRLSMAFILFLALFISWQTTIWHWKEKAVNFLSNPFRRSRIPQFILDAQHPWIIENKNKLERLRDAESYLCSSLTRSATDDLREKLGGGEHGLDVPPDLFDYLEIDNGRLGVDRPGWPNALMRLRELNRCPASLSHVKTFKTSIFAHRGQYSDWDKRILEPLQPPKEVLDLFADVLEHMTSLENLIWVVPSSDAPYFEAHFIYRGLILPSVKRLEPGSMCHFLARLCPNINVLENQAWRSSQESDVMLLQETKFASNLARFAMVASWGWTKPMLQDLVSLVPGIQSLGLWGSLDHRTGDPDDSDSESSTLKESLKILRSLQNLTHLDLADASKLDVGWDGGPWCGNAFFGPGGRRYQRRVARKRAEAVDRVAAVVLEVLPRLTGFSVGGSQAEIIRYENGTLRAKFAWTGRMDEWALSAVPRHLGELDEGIY